MTSKLINSTACISEPPALSDKVDELVRYELSCDDIAPFMVPDEDGDYVRFEDMEKIVDKLKARLAEHDGCSRWNVADSIVLKTT